MRVNFGKHAHNTRAMRVDFDKHAHKTRTMRVAFENMRIIRALYKKLFNL